jgi:MFS transporter, DHA1 family, multidrug resistance protein
MKIALWIAFVLIGYNFIGCLANDIYVPILPFLADILDTNEGLVKFTFSAFFIGSTLGQIPMAIMFSIYNKERTFLFSGILFCSATLLCIDPLNIYQLIIGRFLQGLSFSACNVYLLMEFQARFNIKEQHKLFTLNNAIGALSPLLGPVLGTYFFSHYTWHYNFYLIFIASFILFFAYSLLASKDILKTNQKDKTQELKILYGSYLTTIKDIHFLAATAGPGLVISSLACYLMLAPFIMLREFELSPNEYGYYQAILMTTYIFAMVLSWFIKLPNLISYAKVGGSLLAIGGGIIIILRLAHYESMPFYFASIIACLIGLGCVLNPLIVNAMNNIENKAVGSSLVWLICAICGTFYTVFISVINCDKLLILGGVFTINAFLISCICKTSDAYIKSKKIAS